jgi:ferric iron reductase protein FhuF
MIHILANECKINKNILWENVAVRLNAVIKKNQSVYSQEKIQAILHQLTDENPTWFNKEQNPLKVFCQTFEGKRKTCCRYYQLDKKEEGIPYCLVCPLPKV